MDEQDPGIAYVKLTAPVEEVDPIARFDDDHESGRFCGKIRRRDWLHRP